MRLANYGFEEIKVMEYRWVNGGIALCHVAKFEEPISMKRSDFFC